MNHKKTLALVISLFPSFLLAAITVDGKLDEPEWQNAQSISDFVTVYPNDKSKPEFKTEVRVFSCLLYTSPSPRDTTASRMPSSA